MGSATTVPPSSLAFFAASSALVTVTYGSQFGGTPCSRCSAIIL
jgi:hypothetical protein